MSIHMRLERLKRAGASISMASVHPITTFFSIFPASLEHSVRQSIHAANWLGALCAGLLLQHHTDRVDHQYCFWAVLIHGLTCQGSLNQTEPVNPLGCRRLLLQPLANEPCPCCSYSYRLRHVDPIQLRPSRLVRPLLYSCSRLTG